MPARSSHTWLVVVALAALANVVMAIPKGAGDAAPQAAAGMFLVARRDLPDPNFRDTVVLLLRHDAQGTLGLIVNRRGHVRLSEAAPQLKGAARAAQRLFFGGPVALNQLMMLLRARRGEAGMEPVVEGLYTSSDSVLLERWLAQNKTERDLRLYAGHAGWAPGQLARELARGDWHVMPATAAQVFDAEVETLWQRLIERAPAPEIEVRRQDRVVAAT